MPAHCDRGAGRRARRRGERVQSNPNTVTAAAAQAEAALSPDAREKIEKYIEEEEGAFNRLDGMTGVAITAIAVAV